MGSEEAALMADRGLRVACVACVLLVLASGADIEQEDRVELSHAEGYDPTKTDWGEGFDDMSSVLKKYDKPLSFKSKKSLTEKLLVPPKAIAADKSAVARCQVSLKIARGEIK